MVAATSPGLGIGGGKDRVNFRAGPKAHQPVIPTLDRNRQYACGHIDTARIAQGHRTEKRADGGEPHIPGPHAVPTFLFDAVEKLQNGRSLHIGQREARRFFAHGALQELEQQPERIPIAGHGLWTDSSMGNQMLSEEKLQERSDQGCGWGVNHFGSPPSS